MEIAITEIAPYIMLYSDKSMKSAVIPTTNIDITNVFTTFLSHISVFYSFIIFVFTNYFYRNKIIVDAE